MTTVPFASTTYRQAQQAIPGRMPTSNFGLASSVYASRPSGSHAVAASGDIYMAAPSVQFSGRAQNTQDKNLYKDLPQLQPLLNRAFDLAKDDAEGTFKGIQPEHLVMAASQFALEMGNIPSQQYSVEEQGYIQQGLSFMLPLYISNGQTKQHISTNPNNLVPWEPVMESLMHSTRQLQSQEFSKPVTYRNLRNDITDTPNEFNLSSNGFVRFFQKLINGLVYFFTLQWGKLGRLLQSNPGGDSNNSNGTKSDLAESIQFSKDTRDILSDVKKSKTNNKTKMGIALRRAVLEQLRNGSQRQNASRLADFLETVPQHPQYLIQDKIAQAGFNHLTVIDDTKKSAKETFAENMMARLGLDNDEEGGDTSLQDALSIVQLKHIEHMLMQMMGLEGFQVGNSSLFKELRELEKFSPILGEKDYSKGLPGLYIDAALIAHKANDNKIRPEHLVLAMLQLVEPAFRIRSDFATTSANNIQNVYYLTDPGMASELGRNSFPLESARKVLDVLIPNEIRHKLTSQQQHELIRGAKRSIEKQLFPKDLPFVDFKHADLEMSDELRKLIDSVKADGSIDTDQNLMALVKKMKAAKATTNATTAWKTTHPQLASLEEKAAKGELANVPDVTFDDIGGYEHQKGELEKAIRLFNKSDEEKAKSQIKVPKGILLHGPPGTGKTMFAQAIANSAGCPFFSYSGSEFAQKYYGESEAKIREIFEQASQFDRAIIFIDEIDALVRQRSNNADRSSPGDSSVNQFLTEMDGLAKNSNILVIGATNRLERIDEAAIRPGRLGDRILEIGFPNERARKHILKVVQKDKKYDGIDLDFWAKNTAGFTGAKLAKLTDEAYLLAEERHDEQGLTGEVTVTQEDFDEAFDITILGVKRPEEDRHTGFSMELVAAHEAVGHGAVAWALGRKIRTLSMVARGEKGVQGHVYPLPLEQLEGMTRQAILHDIMIDVAGRAAEMVHFSEEQVTSGATSDMQSVENTIQHYLHTGLWGFGPETPGAIRYRAGQIIKQHCQAAAIEMIKALGKDTRNAMVQECSNHIELRNDDAMNFYERHIDKFGNAKQKKLEEIANKYVTKANEDLAELSQKDFTHVLLNAS